MCSILKYLNTYLVHYLVFKYYLNTPQSEVGLFRKVFKYSGQSICPNTADIVEMSLGSFAVSVQLVCSV